MKIEGVSLIISTYNWPEALKLCLNSILRQTVLPSEVIISDDGSDERTAELIRYFAKKAPFPILHEWHEDRGFRKTIILNKTILRSSYPYTPVNCCHMLILPVNCLILHSIIPLLKQFLITAPDNTGPHEQPYSDRHYNEQSIRSKDYRITIIPEKNRYCQQRYHSQNTQYNTQGYAQ